MHLTVGIFLQFCYSFLRVKNSFKNLFLFSGYLSASRVFSAFIFEILWIIAVINYSTVQILPQKIIFKLIIDAF